MTLPPAPVASLEIEIAVALPAHQRLLSLRVDAGTTVGQALELAAPQLGADGPRSDQPVGVWGVVVARDRVLVTGDRIELYRPLPVDPKETRRRLAREGRTMGQRITR